MNKKLLLAFVFSFAAFLSYAQPPTLTGGNIDPALNDSFVSIVCDTTGITPGPSGASQTWDFHALTATTAGFQATDTGFIVYSSLTSGYSFLSALGLTSDYALENPGAGITSYYNETVATLTNPGSYQNATNYAVYSTPVVLFQFPFTYLTSFTAPYAGLVTYAGISASEAGNVVVTGDAWGTLILPPVPPSSTNRTFTNVLRVYTYQQFRDSANVFGTSYIETDTLKTYTWYMAGYHSPLLSVELASGPLLNEKLVSYEEKQIANHEAVPSVNLDASLKIFPNPAASFVNIEFENNTGSDVRISLVDMLGREVGVIADKLPSGYNQVSYNTTSVASGSYLVKLQSATQSVTRKIEVQ